MTKAEIIQEIHRRTCLDSPNNDRARLHFMLYDASSPYPDEYGRPDVQALLLDLAAQIVKVLEEPNEDKP